MSPFIPDGCVLVSQWVPEEYRLVCEDHPSERVEGVGWRGGGSIKKAAINPGHFFELVVPESMVRGRKVIRRG